MQKRISIVGCAVVAVALLGLVVCFFQPDVLAKPPQDPNGYLQGEYAFGMDVTCVVGEVRSTDYPELPLRLFGRNLKLNGIARNFSYVFSGIVKFNGDGTGAMYGGFQLGASAWGQFDTNSYPVFQNTFTCDVEYEVDSDDNSFTMTLPLCHSIREVGYGSETGVNHDITGIELVGQIARNSKTLLWWDNNTNVEFFTRNETDIRNDRIFRESATGSRQPLPLSSCVAIYFQSPLRSFGSAFLMLYSESGNVDYIL